MQLLELMFSNLPPGLGIEQYRVRGKVGDRVVYIQDAKAC
jgi:hypothetical protein